MEELPCHEKLSFESKEAAEGAAVYAAHRHGTKLKVYQVQALCIMALGKCVEAAYNQKYYE